MSLCQCPERPRCQVYPCERAADWSTFTPPIRFVKAWPHGRIHFMCTPCRNDWSESYGKPMKGIDRPEGADESWRGSILDHLRHASIAISFAERNQSAIARPMMHDELEAYWRRYEDSRGFTQAQRENAATHRRLMRKYALSQAQPQPQTVSQNRTPRKS